MTTAVVVPVGVLVLAFLLAGLGAIVDDYRARRERSGERKEAVEAVIPLLHSINDDRCIGCEACVDVCPTEVLSLVDHIVRVVQFDDCVQCEQCQNVCPTTALVMYRAGGTPRMLTVPELDENFQTGVPGQYLIGEVAGKPLVKNAANLGRAVVEHIARELPAKRATDVLDVAIVGSGPGGLSAGLTCLKRKLSCVVLEKEHVISSTVSRYPKGKHFMAEPAQSANVSYLPVFDASKEDLVAAWQKVVAAVKLPIKHGEAVETVVRGDDGVFTIKTTVATYRAHRVVLATGLRGKPRLLAVPGANLEKVESLLDDPGVFADQDVLVVGGGDSAVEGAMSLADIGARATLSYRGDGFKRCKQGNQKRLAEMQAANKLTVLLESNVTEFTADQVSIKLKDGSVTTIPNHHAFVLIGADTPVAWLETNNVRFVERPHLYTLGASDDVVRRLVQDVSACPPDTDEAIARILGVEHAPAARESKRRVLSVVGQMREELTHAIGDLSSVFKLDDLRGRPTPRPATEAGTARLRTPVKGAPMIPADRLTRAARAVTQARNENSRTVAAFRIKEETDTVTAFKLNDTGSVTVIGAAVPERTEPRAAFSLAHERTYVGLSPVRPRSNKSPPKPKSAKPTHAVSFDTSDLKAWGDGMPSSPSGDTRTVAAFQPRPPATPAQPAPPAAHAQPARTAATPPRPSRPSAPPPPPPSRPAKRSEPADDDATRQEVPSYDARIRGR